MMMKYSIQTFTALLFLLPLNANAQDSNETIRVQLKPLQEARINSPMSGQVTQTLAKDGQHVEEGAILITFECSEQQSGLAQTQARINKQQSLLKSAQKLYDLGSSSQTEIDVLKAELEEAKAARDFAQIQVKKCNITAPFSGRISALSTKPFNSAREGDTMIEIVGDGEMEIEMIIPSLWLSWLKPGAAFSIEIDETAMKYKSKITRIGGRVDPVTQSVKAYGALDETAPELRAGMSGQAIFTPPQKAPDHDHTAPENPSNGSE